MQLAEISGTILNEESSPAALRAALDSFSEICSEVSGVVPNASFDAWAEDSFLESGVAINPSAAAHCVKDYRRSVVFIRGVYAAINHAIDEFPNQKIRILYAGSGPYATLLLPLLQKFSPEQLEIHLLDIHLRSIDSIQLLIRHFKLEGYDINTLLDDACRYQHPETLHIIIAETMQKSLEQEPQFAVTVNLAPQLEAGGIFVPQKIEVEFGLTRNEVDEPVSLVRLLTLEPQMRSEELIPVSIEIPSLDNISSYEPALFTRIQIYQDYWLRDYEAEITLPNRCHDLRTLAAGQKYQASYEQGKYPRWSIKPGTDPFF
jgi:hypothetical protein